MILAFALLRDRAQDALVGLIARAQGLRRSPAVAAERRDHLVDVKVLDDRALAGQAFEIELGLVRHAILTTMNAEKRDFLVWVFGTLASGCFIAVTQLAVKSDLQWLDRRAMVQFAAALPLLVGSAVIFREGLPKRGSLLAAILIVSVAGPVLAIGGVFDLIRTVSA